MPEENSTNVNGGERRASGIEAGACVMLVLHSPREKCWGVLDELSAAGVFLRGLDLNAFEAWTWAVAHDEPFIGLGDLFFPMWRVERVTLDESAGEVPSLAEQFARRTGRSVQELL
ncbi:MAG: hypothetical protein ACR2LC_13360 [Pyrinomonadaceae bacterium]